MKAMVSSEKKRSVYLRVRITPALDRVVKEAAERAGISVSAWATERLVRCARSEVEDIRVQGPITLQAGEMTFSFETVDEAKVILSRMSLGPPRTI